MSALKNELYGINEMALKTCQIINNYCYKCLFTLLLYY